MIISLIIIILLICAFRYGIRRGLLGSLVSLLGYIIVFILSLFLASPLGNIIAGLFSNINDGSGLLATTFYKILSFWIIGIIGESTGIGHHTGINTFRSFQRNIIKAT